MSDTSGPYDIIDMCINNRHPIQKKAGNSEAVIKERRSSGRFCAFLVIRPSAAMSSSRLSGRPLASVALKWVQTNSSGVQVGRIAREGLDVQPRTPGEQGANVGTLVNAAAVPEDDDVPAELAEQGAQEHRDLHMGDVAPRIEMDVEPAAPPPGTHRDGRDRRDFVAAIPMPDDRRVAAGRPGAPDVRNQQEATFVEEHQMGGQALRVFFTATQRYRCQRAMAASSRSTARRSGFWHDQPSVVSSRPT